MKRILIFVLIAVVLAGSVTTGILYVTGLDETKEAFTSYNQQNFPNGVTYAKSTYSMAEKSFVLNASAKSPQPGYPDIKFREFMYKGNPVDDYYVHSFMQDIDEKVYIAIQNDYIKVKSNLKWTYENYLYIKEKSLEKNYTPYYKPHQVKMQNELFLNFYVQWEIEDEKAEIEKLKNFFVCVRSIYLFNEMNVTYKGKVYNISFDDAVTLANKESIKKLFNI